MKKQYKIILAALLAAACLAYAAVVWLRPTAVAAEVLSPAPLGDSFTAQGALVPQEAVILRAGATGSVVSIPAGAGRALSPGDAVVEIDSADLRRELENQIASLKLQQAALRSQEGIQAAQLRTQLAAAKLDYQQQFGEERGSAQALLDLAESNYLQARNAYKDAEELYDQLPPGSSSLAVSSSQLFALEQQMIAARKNLIITQNSTSDAARAYSQALVDSLSAQLGLLGDYSAAQLQVTIDYLESKLDPGPVAAPFAGTVWEVYVEPGEFVAENQPVAKVFSGAGLRLEARLLAEDTVGLRAGDAVSCTLADGTPFQARITFVSPVAQEIVSTIGLTENCCLVELEPLDLPAQAGAGWQADLTFATVAREDVLSVPASAIVPHDGGSAVYLIRGGRAVLAPVETGLRTGGRVEILSGLAAGDRIVTDPYGAEVRQGARVSAGN